MKARVALELCEGPRPGSDSCPLTEFHRMEGAREFSGVPFIRAPILFMRAFPL